MARRFFRILDSSSGSPIFVGTLSAWDEEYRTAFDAIYQRVRDKLCHSHFQVEEIAEVVPTDKEGIQITDSTRQIQRKQRAEARRYAWRKIIEIGRVAFITLCLATASFGAIIAALMGGLTPAATTAALLAIIMALHGAVWLLFKPSNVHFESQSPWMAGVSAVIVLLPVFAVILSLIWRVWSLGPFAIGLTLLGAFVVGSWIAFYGYVAMAVLIGALWWLFFLAPSVLFGALLIAVFGGTAIVLFIPLLGCSWLLLGKGGRWRENPLSVCNMAPVVAACPVALLAAVGLLGMNWPSSDLLFG